MMTRSGHCGTPSSSVLRFRRIALGRCRQQPLETPLQHLAHHRVVVAGRQPLGLDVELAVLVLDEAVRARHDHGADRIGALDVAVVVHLDAARRMRQSERRDQPREQPALGCGIGQLAAERFARVGQRMRDQFLFLAALRRRDLDLEARLDRQGACHQLGFLDRVRQQNEFGRRLVVVELREERGQHLLRRERFLGAAENRRGCPSSARCGRRTPRRRNIRPPDGWRTNRLLPRCAD